MAMANGIGAQAGRAQRSVSATEAAKNAAQNTLDKATKFSQIKGILKTIPPTRENLKKVMALFLKPIQGTDYQIRPDRAAAIPDLKQFLAEVKKINPTATFNTIEKTQNSDFSQILNGHAVQQELISLLDPYARSAAPASTAAGNGGGGAAIPAIPFAPAEIVGTEPGTTLPSATLVHTTPKAALEAPAPYNPATANPEAYMNTLAEEWNAPKSTFDRVGIAHEVIENPELTDDQVISFFKNLNISPESDIMRDHVRPTWANCGYRNQETELMQTRGGGSQPARGWHYGYDISGNTIAGPSSPGAANDAAALAPYNPATANPEAYMNNRAQEFVNTQYPSDRIVIVAEVIGNEELTDDQVISFFENLNLPPDSDIMNDVIRPKWAESPRSKTVALMQMGGGGGGNQPVIDMLFHRYDVNGQRL